MRSALFGRAWPALGFGQYPDSIKILTRIIKILVKQGRPPYMGRPALGRAKANPKTKTLNPILEEKALTPTQICWFAAHP